VTRIFSILPPDPGGSETRSDTASPLSRAVYFKTFPPTEGVNVILPVPDPALLWPRGIRKLTSTADPARGVGLTFAPAITGCGAAAVVVVVAVVVVAVEVVVWGLVDGGAFVLLKFPELRVMRGKIEGETSQSEV
jgi:hypothetical protein